MGKQSHPQATAALRDLLGVHEALAELSFMRAYSVECYVSSICAQQCMC